ncbi:MAG: hypothetical protein ACLTC4_11580 [Hungatella hathewayi]
MKERLTNNLGLKVLAIFLTFFLWLIVSNVSNPVKQDSKEVVVDIINKEVLAATIEVVGEFGHGLQRDTLDATMAQRFYAYADLSER